MTTIELEDFTKWKDLQEHAKQFTEGKSLYSGQGIYHFTNNTTILKSVDNTYYYDDNLENPEKIQYTLFGNNGDQSLTELRFNWKLLNEERKIYVFRVSKKSWIWYGEYTIDLKSIQEKQHIDINNKLRKIYILTLHRKH